MKSDACLPVRIHASSSFSKSGRGEGDKGGTGFVFFSQYFGRVDVDANKARCLQAWLRRAVLIIFCPADGRGWTDHVLVLFKERMVVERQAFPKSRGIL